MKIASYRTESGPSYGAVIGVSVVDLKALLGLPTLRDALEADALAAIEEKSLSSLPRIPLSRIALTIPTPNAEKIICIGRNYRGHVAEGHQPLPRTPSTFMRLHRSFVAPGAALVRPKLSEQFDYEGELALIIGKAGRHVRKENALAHIAGYACMQEGSIRDYQFEHCLAVGKNFSATGSIGPWMAMARDIPDPTTLTLTTTLNGVEVQRTLTDDLIFDIPTLIAYVSSFTELTPGDVIATGTPEGVGFARKPPLWLKPGDEVVVEISGVGQLRNSVVAERPDGA